MLRLQTRGEREGSRAAKSVTSSAAGVIGILATTMTLPAPLVCDARAAVLIALSSARLSSAAILVIHRKPDSPVRREGFLGEMSLPQMRSLFDQSVIYGIRVKRDSRSQS